MEDLWKSENEKYMEEAKELNASNERVSGILNIRIPYIRDISPNYKLDKVFV